MKRPSDGWDAEEEDALRGIEADLERLQARHAGDPPIDLLRAARADVLPEREQAAARRQLDESRWNQALVEGSEAADAQLSDHDRWRLLRRVQHERNRGDRESSRAAAPARWPWRAGAAAAAIVVVAVGVWTIWRRGENRSAELARDTQVAVVNPPPAPAFVLPLDPPQIKISPSALTFRGTGSDNTLLADLKDPFDALRAGDYPAAARQLAPLAARYPSSVEVPYYEGIAQLFLNNPAAALDSLARAERLADSSFAADVAWYQAVAAERTGRRDEARRRLARVCAQKGPRSADACAAKQKLK